MNRVLLFIDDYSELMFVQIILKKLGFDVDILQNSHTLSDRLLSFHPDLMILTGQSRKVSTEGLIKQAMDQKSDLRFILLGKNGDDAEAFGKGILCIGSPVKPMELIRATAESCEQSAEGLMEKFKKFRGQLNLTEEEKKKWDLEDVSTENEDSERNESYKEYLKSHHVKVASTFNPEAVQKAVKTTRKTVASDQEVDGDRQAFTVELFKKAKS